MYDNTQIPLINNKTITLNETQKNLLDPNLKYTCTQTQTFDGLGDGSVIYDLSNPTATATLGSGGVITYYEISTTSGTPVTINGQDLFYTQKYMKVAETTVQGDVTNLGNGQYRLGTSGGSNDVNKATFRYVETNSSGSTNGAEINVDLNIYIQNINGAVIDPTNNFYEIWNLVIANGNVSSGTLTEQAPTSTQSAQLLAHTQPQSTLTGGTINISTQGATNDGNNNPNLDYTGVGKGTGFDITYTRGGIGDSKNVQFGEVNVVSTLKPVLTQQTKCVEWTIQKWQQEINVIEYESNCNNEDCNYKEVQTTKIIRDVFENQDSSKKYGNWYFTERNLKDLKNTYSFDGNIIVNLQTDFPWIAEGSYRTGFQEIKVYLFSDCCSNCGKDCTKQKGCKYELVVPKKFIPKNCFDKEPPKTWKNCLQVERPHWVKTCSETSSNLCNWTPASTNCQVRFNYLNKQQFNEFIVDWYTKNYDLESFLKTHIWNSLNNCGVGSILKTNDKTIYGAINELLTKLALKK